MNGDRDERRPPAAGTSPPIAVACLVVALTLVWVTLVYWYPRREDWWPYVFHPASPTLRGLLISPFIHQHPFHLGMNLAALWLFGASVERAIGSLRFMLLFLTSAWCASGMHWSVIYAFQVELLSAWEPGTEWAARGAALGASGAVAGVLGVYAVRFPHRPVRLPGLPWEIGPFYLLGAWLLLELVQALGHTALHSPRAISHWAHFAGFIWGMWWAKFHRLHEVATDEQLEGYADDAIAQRDYRAAVRAWQVLLARRPDDLGLRRNLVAARMALGDRDGAHALAAETLASEMKADLAREAVADYRRFTDLCPDLRLPHGVRYRIANWLLEAGDPVAAYAALLAAAEEEPPTDGAAAALLRAGEIAVEQLRDPVRARQAWRRILLEFPASPFADTAQRRLQQLSQPARRSPAGGDPSPSR